MIKKVPLKDIIDIQADIVDFVDDVPEGFYDADPWDDQRSNALRAVTAARAVETYGRDRGMINDDGKLHDDLPTIVQDLITDVIHFCDGHNIDFQELVERAESMYAQEWDAVHEQRQREKEGGRAS